MLDISEDLRDVVVELGDKIACIIETFVEVLAGVVARDRDILGEEVGPATITYKLAVVVDGEVRAVNLLRGHP